MKLKRGQKLCKNCNNINGARAHVCKHCNKEFVAGTNNKKPTKQRKKKRFEFIENWQELQTGDRIKVVARTGSYYINQDGEKQYLTDPGLYTVDSVDGTGLRVFNGAYGYIYMGPEVPSTTIPNMYRSPHKILRSNMPIRA